MVSGVVPVAVGSPVMVAVPLPLSVKVRPAGSVPAVAVREGVGEPLAVIATDPIWLTAKSATGIVRPGATPVSTVMVTASVAVLPEEFVACKVTGYVAG
jgi:hypothetical protein